MCRLEPLTTRHGRLPSPSSQFCRTPASDGSAAIKYGSSSRMNGPCQAACAAASARRPKKRPPVRVFDIGEAGESLRDGGGQVAPLHGRRRLVRDRVEAAAAPRPLGEQPRLAYPAAAPDDRERPRAAQRPVQPPQLVDAIQELHRSIMRARIMLTIIITCSIGSVFAASQHRRQWHGGCDTGGVAGGLLTAPARRLAGSAARASARKSARISLSGLDGYFHAPGGPLPTVLHPLGPRNATAPRRLLCTSLSAP